MKKLICAQDIEKLKQSQQTVCVIDENTIITPSAKDMADACGITFSIKEECNEMPNLFGSQDLNENQIYQILKVLVEKGLVNGIFKPYTSENHENGLKVIRGNSVQMDVFDTGNPNASAYYQELVSKEESHMSAGFLVIDHSEFEWELTYEEIDYVIEGRLTVTIDGKKYTAQAGDVVFVPSGSKVIWGSPDKAKVFYATYPANWADLL